MRPCCSWTGTESRAFGCRSTRPTTRPWSSWTRRARRSRSFPTDHVRKNARRLRHQGMTRLALTLAALLVPQLATAQFGGLVKKVKDKVSPSSSTTTGTPTGKVVVAVTPDVVDRFITGFQAERAERDRQETAHASDGVGQLYLARDLVARCDSMKKADSVHLESFKPKLMSGDRQAGQDMQKW